MPGGVFLGSPDPKSGVKAPIEFRGQDSRKEGLLGANPNAAIEDEYIHNLQQ